MSEPNTYLTGNRGAAPGLVDSAAMSDPSSKTRREVMRGFIPASPMVGHLGIELVELGEDSAELALPFTGELATVGDIVHGGAIATLIDTAGMAASWSDDVVPESPSGSTISMNVDFIAAARGSDLRATATVIRRGRGLCFTEVTITDLDGQVVARGSVVHRFGTS
jgi:uncharacterized protein (TIGR00369 family)